jgi:tellurite resistance protein TehA-like permease
MCSGSGWRTRAIRWPRGSWPGVAAAVWLGLTYGVPASLLARSRDSVLGDVNGTWLLWVVATQSLSVVAATLVRTWPSRSGLLAPFAVGLWSIGLVLYLLLVSLILQRWLTVPVTPQTLSPPYWILMGATAIIVLAGAHILALPAALAVVRATAGSSRGSPSRCGPLAPGGSRCSSYSVSGATSGTTGR